MNLNTAAVLEKMRLTLKDELEGRNLQNANLNEAELAFIGEARDLIAKAGYEMEGFDADAPTEAYVAALKAIAEEEGGEVSESISEMLSPYTEAKAKPIRCPDCGEEGERKGHQNCQYPQD